MALTTLLHRRVNKTISALTSKIYYFKTQSEKEYSSDVHVKPYDFDSNEEIVENYLTNVMLIGINLPEEKNNLTDNALDMLFESIKKFSMEKNLTAAVLHGCGGNFCTGIQTSETSLKKGEKIIKSLYDLKKPILAALSGYTNAFGCQLAVMCDIRIMEETAHIGFGENILKESIPTEVLERLFANVGLSSAMQMILTTCTFKANEAAQKNLVNRIVACGCSLGQSINFAKSISLVPSEVVMKQKSRILSLI